MAEQDLFGDVPAEVPRPRQRRPAPQPPAFSWFFALRPSPEDAARIHAYADSLLLSRGISGSRVAPERLHITLEFLGNDQDVDKAALDAAGAAAAQVRIAPMEVRFDAGMTFGSSSGPFVLVGGEGLDVVRQLRLVLGCALAERGFAPPLAYEPHMTLCYDKQHQSPRAPIEPVGFHVAEFALVKSHLGLSRHEVIRTWPLPG